MKKLSSLWLPLSWSQTTCLAGCCGCILSLNKPQYLDNPRLLPYITAINLRPPGLLIHRAVGRCQTLLHHTHGFQYYAVHLCSTASVRHGNTHGCQCCVSVCQTLPHTWSKVVYGGDCAAATVHGYCRTEGLCAIWLWVSGFHWSGFWKSDASRNIKHLNWSLKGHSMILHIKFFLSQGVLIKWKQLYNVALEDLCQVWQNNPEDVIQIGFGNCTFLIESLSYKLAVWSLKDMGIYSAGTVLLKCYKAALWEMYDPVLECGISSIQGTKALISLPVQIRFLI